MNFLAHAYLSFNEPEIMIGNMIGDFVKGNNYKNLPDMVRNGVILHRKIDSFTDTHKAFKKSVFRISDTYGKYRFVICDLFYDHILAKSWNYYHSVKLKDYTTALYSIISANYDILPRSFHRTFAYMERTNWLYNYQYPEMLKIYLNGISQRSRYGSNFEKSVDDFIRNYDLFEKDFNIFFPEIIEMSRNYIDEISFQSTNKP